MKKPLVSIIIPTYNEEKDISACLDSILKQDIAHRIEILIVDDDSVDGTLKICEEYSKKLNIRILKNGSKNAERGKMIGLHAANGEFFMYFDADMEFADKNWFSVSLKPLLKNKDIVGTLASFGVNKNHNALTRCISYNIFQGDPIFVAFTPSIQKSIIKKEEEYFLCKFNLENIPAQSLCLYRIDVLKKIFKNENVLMDNDVPVILTKKGYNLFAFCPQVRVYHFLLKNLRELFRKRLRGVLKTYMSNLAKREYKWFNLKNKKNLFKLILWVIFTNLIIPSTIFGVYKTIKNRDVACMYEPLINLVSTDALVFGFIKSKGGFSSLSKL